MARQPDDLARDLVSGKALPGVVPEWRWGCRKCGAYADKLASRDDARRELRRHRDKCPEIPPWADDRPLQVSEAPLAEVAAELAVGQEPIPPEPSPAEGDSLVEGSISELESLPAAVECFGHHDPEDEACFECLVAKECAASSTAAEAASKEGSQDGQG
jgi:hypothetical protein